MNQSIERKIKLSRVYVLELVSRMNLFERKDGNCYMNPEDEQNAIKFLIWFCEHLGYDEVEIEK